LPRLPIELNVEKKVGKPGHKVTAAEFRQKCRDYASKQVEAQKADFVRMGVFGDWDHPYLTMDFRFEANIVRTLAKIIDRGHLHRGFKPVHWCLGLWLRVGGGRGGVSDKQSSAVDVAFPFVDRAEAASRLGCDDESEPIELAIWTTTPWTLACQPRGGTVSRSGLRAARSWWVAGSSSPKRLAEDCAQRFGAESHEIVGRAKGAALEGLSTAAALRRGPVPVVLGEHVTTEAGTGCVHTAPAHGLEDFDMGQRYGLEVYNPVGGNGVYHPDTPVFAGQHIFKANDDIVAALVRAQGACCVMSLSSTAIRIAGVIRRRLFFAPHRSGSSA
jgi:isoleucyl-tRNA synthetase